MTAPFQYDGQTFWRRGPGVTPFETHISAKAVELATATRCGRATAKALTTEMNTLLAAHLAWLAFERDTGCNLEGLQYTAWPGTGYLDIDSGAGIGNENVIENRFYWNSGDGGNTGAVGLTHTPPTDPKWLDTIVRNIYLGETWRWSSRAYRACSNLLFENITLEGNEEEHGFYHNMAGVGTNPGAGRLAYPAVTYRGIRAIGIGAQIIQNIGACARLSAEFDSGPPVILEVPDPVEDDTTGGDIIVEDLYAKRCTNEGAGNTRASFSLSFFSSRNPVVVSNVFIDASMFNPSYGMLLCEGLSTASYWTGVGGTAALDRANSITTRGAYSRSFTLNGGVFLTYRPNRPIFRFDDMGPVTITDVHVDCDSGASQRTIKFFNQVGPISMTGMSQRGGVVVNVNGTDYGTLGSTFTWP